MNGETSIALLLTSTTTLLKHHSDSARLDAELLLCHCLKKPRSYLYTWPEQALDARQLSLFNALASRRLQGEPVAYLTGSREFWSVEFDVTPDTLIPRPDTEVLVEQALEKLTDTTGPFLDLGTGSGVIAVSIAMERPDIEVHATDISNAALDVARVNAKKFNAQIGFINCAWFEELESQNYAVIASNPPYIAADDPHLKQNGLPYEPITALQSSSNGFADITAIIKESPTYLGCGGWLLLEHGHSQASKTRNIMQAQGFRNIDTVKDLSGNDRVTRGQKA